jgi:hypothetical protein
MGLFKDRYHYLKDIRWVLNNTLAYTTIGTSNTRKDKEGITTTTDKEDIIILDLEKWSEYKLKRLAEEDDLL